jgi:hypothetical protein
MHVHTFSRFLSQNSWIFKLTQVTTLGFFKHLSYEFSVVFVPDSAKFKNKLIGDMVYF